MNLLVLLLALPSPSNAYPPPLPGTGSLVGYVTAVDGRPLWDAEVKLMGTDITRAEADGRGFYRLDSIPPGEYLVYAHIYTWHTESVVMIESDRVTRLDLPMWEGYADDPIEWHPASPDTVRAFNVDLKLPEGISADGLTVAYGSRFYRYARSDEGGYRLLLSLIQSPITWCLPSISDRTIDIAQLSDDSCLILSALPDTAGLDRNRPLPDDPLIPAYATRDEWVAPEYKLDRRLLDLSNWGDPDLEGYGFIGGRIYFEEDSISSWRVLLIYFDRAVLLREGQEPCFFDYGFHGVGHFAISPRIRCAVFFESIGDLGKGGNAQFVDFETGRSVVFDPSPERPEVDFGHMGYETYDGPNEQMLLSDNGHAFTFADSGLLKVYDESLNVDRALYLNHARVWISYPGQMPLISSDGSRLLCRGSLHDHAAVIMLHGDGTIAWTSSSLVPDGLFGQEIAADLACSVAVIGGVAFQGENGWITNVLEEESYFELQSVSQGGAWIAGSSIEPRSRREIAEVAWGQATSDSLNRALICIGPDGWAEVVSVSDAGCLLLETHTSLYNGFRRLFLLSPEGSLIWAGPESPDYLSPSADGNTGISLSPHGMRIGYRRGMFIEILTLEEE